MQVPLFMGIDSSELHTIEQSKVERDLGIMLSNNLKWDAQIDNMILTANGTLAMLKNAFKFWSPANFRKLYCAFVRPHLEYCTSVWNPTQKKDIARLERVQRRATKIVPSIRNLDYQSRLAAIGITTLKERRDRGDLIQMYKLNSNRNQAKLIALRPGTLVQNSQLPSSNLRRAKGRLTRERCQSSARDFTNRVCQI